MTLGDLHPALPAYAITALREALPAFGRKIKGFDMPDAVLTGVETRTSSPLKITRGDNFQSLNTAGLYPAGEGASYAGGILSAGVDGIKVAGRGPHPAGPHGVGHVLPKSGGALEQRQQRPGQHKQAAKDAVHGPDMGGGGQSAQHAGGQRGNLITTKSVKAMVSPMVTYWQQRLGQIHELWHHRQQKHRALGVDDID